MQPRDQIGLLRQAWQRYHAEALPAEPTYPGARRVLSRDLEETLARLIPADASVLEVGCGRGDLLAALPHAVRVGLDTIPSLVEVARATHSAPRFAVADITVPEQVERALGDERFDAVVCDRLGHAALDVRELLEGLRSRLRPGGRIYLVTFNYLWELPTRLAERTGLKVPSPTANWLTETDFDNLFELCGLESVRFVDRMLLPVEAPGLAPLANRYLVNLPGCSRLAMYRVYVLRERAVGADAEPLAAADAPSVSVVVPARNEAGNILAAVERTPVMGRETEIIFVEGGSKDGTWERIAEVVRDYRGPLRLSMHRQTGKGKGDAVRLGFAHARGDILMILDADLTVPPEDLPVFYRTLVRGHADFLQGTRLVYPMEAGAMRFLNKLGNVGFSLLFSHLLQQPIKDTLCGTKVLWRRDYERIAAGRSYFGDFDPFGDFDLIFGAARLNLKIREIPVRYRERVYGQTNIDRWRHGLMLLQMSAVAARKLRYV